MKQQIENFLSSLQNLATDNSNPPVIMQLIPVLKDKLVLQQNQEYYFIGLVASPLSRLR